MRLQIQRLDPSLPVPSYERTGDAGLDLDPRESVVLASKGGLTIMPTGISTAIEPGFVGLMPRSYKQSPSHALICPV
jgi:dUTP pyrophosphatase